MSGLVINVAEEMSDARLSGFHVRFAILLGAILFIDGYDLFNAAYVAPYVREQWALSSSMVGIMLSIGLAGLATGALLQGPLADRLGRRSVLVAAVWLLGLTSLALAAVAVNFTTFCILRGLLGISLGMISPLAFVYINEWAPSHCANRYATIAFVLPFSLGGIFAGIAGMTIAPTFGWQALYVIGAVAIPIAVVCQRLLPESVRYLAARGKRQEVGKILSDARPERRAVYENAKSFVTGEASSDRTSITQLFSPRYRNLTVIVWLSGALSLFCLHGLTGWLPSIVLREGAPIQTAFGYGTLLMTMQIVGGAAAGSLADRYDRVTIMGLGFVGGALSLLLLLISLSTNWGFFAVAATGFFIFGTQALMNNYQAMSYDTVIRSTAVGCAVAVNRLGGVLGPIMIGWTQESAYGVVATLGMLAVAQLIASALIVTRRGRR